MDICKNDFSRQISIYLFIVIYLISSVFFQHLFLHIRKKKVFIDFFLFV